MGPSGLSRVVRFQGIHPDAATGASIVVASSGSFGQNTSTLFRLLRDSGRLDTLKKTTEAALKLEREPKNRFDSSAVAVYWVAEDGRSRLKLGYLPTSIGKGLAPLIDRGQLFSATLLKMIPYRNSKNGQWSHRLHARLEYLSPPDRAPDFKMARQVERIIDKARSDKGNHYWIRGLVPNEFNHHKMQGGTLIEKQDYERSEVVFYWKNQLLSRVRVNPENMPAPQFVINAPDPVKEKVGQLLNKHL